MWLLTGSLASGQLTKMAKGIEQIRELLKRALRKPHEAGDLIAEALYLLGKLQASQGEAAPAAAARRHVGVATYRISKVPGRGMMLIESRNSQAHPFRVPEQVYSALGEVMQGRQDHLDFKGLRSRAGKNLRRELPDYMVRVVIRFWMQTPPLLERVGMEYRLLSPGTFLEDVRRRWAKLSVDENAAGP